MSVKQIQQIMDGGHGLPRSSAGIIAPAIQLSPGNRPPANRVGMLAPGATGLGTPYPGASAGTTYPNPVVEGIVNTPEAGTPYPGASAGTIYPANTVFNDDPRPVLAFDWSANNLDCTYDGTSVFSVKKVEDLAALLQEPHKIVCEASFESFVPGRRQAMAKLLRDAGHELYVFRPTATARFRRKNEIEKSNVNDAQVIYRIAMETRTHVYPLLAPDLEWSSQRAALNRKYFEIKMAKLKPELLIRPAKEILGRFSSLSQEAKLMFGNGKPDKYSETLLAAVYFATLHTDSRHEFERVLGLWQSAHPSLLRSDIHHHGYGSVRKRTSISEYRKAIRTLRSIFRAAGVGVRGTP